ncbi:MULTISPECIES: SDR family NAD(P)-dependent oxidoreductase [Mycobacteriaceae]|uniref:3-oxoacyl-[acyl-carrier-protein] reductase MabA n=2 Tax=Mycolicibacterium fortuitum TaxID=1766 RepID=A0A378V035_MYCFO|nr:MULTISPECIES: SDR family oxidoreductase [Mycobacteriaceae]AIY44539.1 3-oxoacyl-[acyl-carrier protein] reductase [Mycobacterium sp. VKM Ac-1817D]CRL80733.1 short-chain dehydrogenase/reductase SDR [Mycolicibacter nonchromogenicus]EJZ11862.1 oxidoreductase [Mycolicibacterium fortuitum subsp. fortuitum DSM 46621 = ATCC 6841 = JCM 6387]MCA4756763.1 SDR family oxidoreductase [Mycolicibacterium fortuitum]MDG5770549.1 SDR family NAD(P)-dependent oxidoreductase [Mycolicibacterium fortuitum]
MTQRTAVVTGASRGIGAQISTRLAAEGWDLIVTARNQAGIEEFAAALAADSGRHVRPIAADMADPLAPQIIADAIADLESLDALILNAAMGTIGRLDSFPLRRLDKLLAINLRAPYALIQNLLPALRLAGEHSPWGSRVIAMASMTGLAGEPLNSAYGATKAALISLCETLSVEEYSHGVNASAVCPGYVATDMTADLPGVDPAAMITAADVAEITVCLTRLSKQVTVPFLPLTRPGPGLWRA